MLSKMRGKKIFLGFITVFSISILVSVGVTLLWSLLFHGIAAIDWETSFRFSLVLGIILPIIESGKTDK
jgi:hypothetical protein